MTSALARSAEAAPAAPLDHAPGLERAFARVPDERAYEVARVEGVVPAFVRGRYYLNGPARFARGGRAYRHWLDGDGMVASLRFTDGGARFASRFVRSAKWTAEESAGRALFRTFGTAFPGDRLLRGVALESPANVSVVAHAGRLLALGEQGRPYELHPDTLETRGAFDFDGTLGALAPFGAHAKAGGGGELWNFGVSYAADRPSLNLYRLGGQGPARRTRLPLPYPASLHDFALSPRHAVFYVHPHLLDMPALAGGASLLDALRWRPELGSRLLVVERERGQASASVDVGSRYCLHTINAFEDGDTLTLDLLELDRPVYDQYLVPELFTDVGPGRPVRLRVDLRTGALLERREIAGTRAPDFVALDLRRQGRATDDAWVLDISAAGRAGRKFFDTLLRVSWSELRAADAWRAPAGRYLAGEPLFLGDPAEDAAVAAGARASRGALLVPIYDGARDNSAFALFDAFDLAAGPRATLGLEAPIHLAFHSVFVREPAHA